LTLEDALRVAGQAEQVAKEIGNPEGRGWGLAGVGKPEDRGRALAALAEALAGTWQFEDARRVAADITELWLRAEALATIAFQLAETGDVTQAARIIAATWTLGEWATPLPALVAIRSSALVVLGKNELRANR
jgi:hypothetical protein